MASDRISGVKTHFISIISVFLFAGIGVGEQIPIMIDPVFRGSDREGMGAFALEIAQAELSGDGSILPVDRRALDKILDEQNLAASGLGDPAHAVKVGKLLSAKYIVSTKGIVAGERMMVVARIVQTETTLFRNKTITLTKEGAVEDVAAKLTEHIRNGIRELGETVPEGNEAVVKQVEIPEGTTLSKIALYVPEATDGQRRAVDPACEHRLMRELKKLGFPIVQLAQSSHAITFGENGRPQGEAFKALLEAARDKEVEVLVIGEAFSQRAGTLGSLNSSRARVELHAIKTSDQSVIASGACYGTGLDTALAIAGKKAIEDATDRVFFTFVSEMIAE